MPSSTAHAEGRPPRGRYAPSPTGLLHLGNARTALAAWLSVRTRGGAFVWRLEDLDPPRVVPGMAEAAAEDLEWLGLDWDEGHGAGGPFGPYEQSARGAFYEEALRVLHEAGRLFPCRLSRRELASISSAPHPGEEEATYPASARPGRVDDDWFARLREGLDPPAAIRFRVDATPVRFVDRLRGVFEERLDLFPGDFVLKRRDGLYAYQLAVVVDDAAMDIDEVVRGADLLPSTARQAALLDALGAPRPSWIHVPMVRNAAGEKLSKRDEALSLRSLRESGVHAEQVTGFLAYSLGLLGEPRALTCAELAGMYLGIDFWNRVGTEDFVLRDDAVERMKSLPGGSAVDDDAAGPGLSRGGASRP